jgi:hypothetical protein
MERPREMEEKDLCLVRTPENGNPAVIVVVASIIMIDDVTRIDRPPRLLEVKNQGAIKVHVDTALLSLYF